MFSSLLGRLINGLPHLAFFFFEMIFCSFLLLFCSSKTIYLNVTALENQNCEDELGCNIEIANSTIDVNDNIILLNPELEKEEANRFILFINSTVSKNISLNGQSKNAIKSIISEPGFEASELAAIHVENSTFSVSNIQFKKFLIPVLNGLHSDYAIVNCTFSESKCTASALIAFVNSSVVFNSSVIRDNDANSQSLFIAVNSSITFNHLNASTNFMESRDVRASFHFLNATADFRNSLFFSNTLKLPLVASSNSSNVAFYNVFFDFNNVYTTVALEFNSSFSLHNSSFRNNRGGLAVGGYDCQINIIDSFLSKHTCDDMLIIASESDLSINNTKIIDSTIASIAHINIEKNLTKEMTIQHVILNEIQSKATLFSAIGGTVTFDDLSVEKIQSDSEIVVFSQQMNGSTIIRNSYFNSIQSHSKVSAAFSVMNTTYIRLSNTTMTQNLICGGLFENTSILVHDSNFSNNQCLPQGNALPLAMITNSLCSNATVRDSTFSTNTALSGCVFLLNSTGTIENIEFNGNNAVQGSAIFGAGLNVTVTNVSFVDNSAMAQGGSVMISQGNADINDCNFEGNKAPQGAAIVLRDAYNINIRNTVGVRNNSTNGSFINADGDKLALRLNSVEIDDDVDVSLFIDHPERVIFTKTSFNCKVKCNEVTQMTPRPDIHTQDVQAAPDLQKDEDTNKEKEQKNKVNDNPDQNVDGDEDELNEEEEGKPNTNDTNKLQNDELSLPIFFGVIPIVIFVCAGVYFKLGSRGIKKLFHRMFKDGGKREL